jgi:hypothetical protein
MRRKPVIIMLAHFIGALLALTGAITLVERWTDRTPHLNEMRSVWHPQKLEGARP